MACFRPACLLLLKAKKTCSKNHAIFVSLEVQLKMASLKSHTVLFCAAVLLLRSFSKL